MDAISGMTGAVFGTAYTSFDMQIRFRFNTLVGSNGAFGVMFGDGEIYYRQSDGKWVFDKGGATTVFDNSSVLAAGKWYILSLRLGNGVCEVYFEGEKVLEFTLNTDTEQGLKVFSRGILSSLSNVTIAENQTLDTTLKAGTDEQGDNNKAIADVVIAALNILPALNDLTLNDKAAVEAARAAYNALTAEQKALVTNYDKLVAAESRIAELENNGGGGGLLPGAIVGIVVGSVAALGLIGFFVYLFAISKRKYNKP
jgi:hypothetical protein